MEKGKILPSWSFSFSGEESEEIDYLVGEPQ